MSSPESPLGAYDRAVEAVAAWADRQPPLEDVQRSLDVLDEVRRGVDRLHAARQNGREGMSGDVAVFAAWVPISQAILDDAAAITDALEAARRRDAAIERVRRLLAAVAAPAYTPDGDVQALLDAYDALRKRLDELARQDDEELDDAEEHDPLDREAWAFVEQIAGWGGTAAWSRDAYAVREARRLLQARPSA